MMSSKHASFICQSIVIFHRAENVISPISADIGVRFITLRNRQCFT